MSADKFSNTKRKPRQYGRLNREVILAAALRLVDRESIDALTMRRLADELGSAPMSLYAHFATRDEIIDGLADKALEALDLEPDPRAPWPEQLLEIFEGVHQVLLAHPGLIHILHVRDVTSERSLHAVERILSILRTGGFDGSEAVLALGALESYTFGFTVHQRARTGRDQERRLAQLQQLSPDDFPNITDLARDFATWTSDEHFSRGLRRLLNGLRAGAEDA